MSLADSLCLARELLLLFTMFKFSLLLQLLFEFEGGFDGLAMFGFVYIIRVEDLL